MQVRYFKQKYITFHIFCVYSRKYTQIFWQLKKRDLRGDIADCEGDQLKAEQLKSDVTASVESAKRVEFSFLLLLPLFHTFSGSSLPLNFNATAPSLDLNSLKKQPQLKERSLFGEGLETEFRMCAPLTKQTEKTVSGSNCSAYYPSFFAFFQSKNIFAAKCSPLYTLGKTTWKLDTCHGGRKGRRFSNSFRDP